jgi:hypothetical protein
MRLFAPIAFMAALAGTTTLAESQGTALKAAAIADEAPLAVIELFTSQGCSSCPKADALLGQLAARKDVVALSFSVDYWDYLGWKDTLASSKFSERQKLYNKMLRDKQPFTPQFIINGAAFVASDPARTDAENYKIVGTGVAGSFGTMDDAISQGISQTNAALLKTRVPLRITVEQDKLRIEAGGAADGGQTGEATLWLALIAKSVVVPIARGENRGKTVTYHNAVRELIPVGMWNGRPLTVQLDRQVIARGADRCGALLQQGRGGPIIGAGLIEC